MSFHLIKWQWLKHAKQIRNCLNMNRTSKSTYWFNLVETLIADRWLKIFTKIDSCEIWLVTFWLSDVISINNTIWTICQIIYEQNEKRGKIEETNVSIKQCFLKNSASGVRFAGCDGSMTFWRENISRTNNPHFLLLFISIYLLNFTFCFLLFYFFSILLFDVSSWWRRRRRRRDCVHLLCANTLRNNK